MHLLAKESGGMMAVIRGKVWDKETGRALEARVAIVSSIGRYCAPSNALHKAGAGNGGRAADPTGTPFFYSEGTFEVEVPGGQTDITVERGTEFRPLRVTVRPDAGAVCDVDLALERWIRLPEQGWYAGNTHLHYPEHEQRPEERLRLEPRVEDLPVLAISILKRRDERPASNIFKVGTHPFSDARHIIDVGEESRHESTPWQIGLGHIMLLNLKKIVEPVGRGLLVDDSSPDYPPLVDACDETHRDGGIVLWCHNGLGMEAPVAAILRRIDAINVFDPYWFSPEYEIWYHLLNCGLQLPISTGSDWYLCSSNRVYVDVGSTFTYANWLGGLCAGRTFATNGPVVRITVDGQSPSNAILDFPHIRRTARVEAAWESLLPIDRIEIVCDGRVAAVHDNVSAELSGILSTDLDVTGAAWIAARCSGARRTSWAQPLWAHTSPVYLRQAQDSATRRHSAGVFLSRLDNTLTWLREAARFDDAAQRDHMIQLFAGARERFARLALH